MNDIKECKLLVVDDAAELLTMIERFLRKEGFTRIYTANNCRDALRIFEEVKPHCAILDVMLPDGNGFDLLQEFRRTSNLPVLFLSARDEDDNRLLGLGLGADDYVAKPFLPRELILRLTAILKRVYFPPSKQDHEKPVFRLGEILIDLNTGEINRYGEVLTLTAKEYALLEKLYENRSRIVTADSLTQAAWGDVLYGYENTLMVHIRHLREKLEPDPSHPCYLLTVRGLGYKLMAEEA